MYTIRVKQPVQQICEYDVKAKKVITKTETVEGDVYLAIYELSSERIVWFYENPSLYYQTFKEFKEVLEEELPIFWLVFFFALLQTKESVIKTLTELGICPGPKDWEEDYWDRENPDGNPKQVWEYVLNWYESQPSEWYLTHDEEIVRKLAQYAQSKNKQSGG